MSSQNTRNAQPWLCRKPFPGQQFMKPRPTRHADLPFLEQLAASELNENLARACLA